MTESAPEPTVTLPRGLVYELLAHLIASADLCAIEPSYYGTFRLLDAASTLAHIVLDCGMEDRWLADLRADIEEHKLLLMSDRDAYYAYLSEVAKQVAERLMHTVPDTDPRPAP